MTGATDLGDRTVTSPSVTAGSRGRFVRYNIDLNDNGVFQDIRELLPCLIIMILGLTFVITVFPYVFSTVIKQIIESDHRAEMIRQNKTL